MGTKEGATLEGVLEGRYMGGMERLEVFVIVEIVEGVLGGSHELGRAVVGNLERGRVIGLLVGSKVACSVAGKLV